jgi:hypothetical protein
LGTITTADKSNACTGESLDTLLEEADVFVGRGETTGRSSSKGRLKTSGAETVASIDGLIVAFVANSAALP